MLHKTQREMDKLQNIVNETLEDVVDERKKMFRETLRQEAEAEIAAKKKSMQIGRKTNRT